MKISISIALVTFFAVFAAFDNIAGITIVDPSTIAESALAGPRKHLRPFRSEAELKAFLKKISKRRRAAYGAMDQSTSVPIPSPSTPAPAVKSVSTYGLAGAKADDAGKDKNEESVTNVQHVGVDEGGIVKVHGGHLVVLRRGRLFTIAVGDNSLKPVSAINAYGPGIDPDGTWYDEMLISDDTIIVIGYSYERGGTEVGLFQINSVGELKYRSTYHLRSDDYYSSRNYSSRLIGEKLIFYSPLYLFADDEEDPLDSFPAVRRWHKGAKESEFRRIAAASRVYRAGHDLNADEDLALHTVTVCDLAGGEMACKATVVMGPPGEVFYVSPQSVYVWTSEWDYEREAEQQRSTLFKMPLDGSGPSAVRVAGSPVDQFSFLETEDQELKVLVRSEGGGDGMWRAEVAAGDVALLRVSPWSFSDGSTSVPSSHYKPLPKPEGSTFQNRFVGNYLLYGTGSGWGTPEKRTASTLFAVNLNGDGVSRVKLEHGIDRIEALGSDAVVVGTDGKDLHFSSVRLGTGPEAVDRYTLKEASQGELRSHGFFYKPQDAGSGILGLPVTGPSRPGYKHLIEGSASIMFLRNDGLKLKGLGDLESRSDGGTDDDCRASCVDWYGNARPLFLKGRVFALLGYEIVEGAIGGNGIVEKRRISFAPGTVKHTQQVE